MSIALHHADMLEWLAAYAAQIATGEAEPFDSCCTDPPYHLTSIVRRFGKEGSAAVKVPDGGDGAFARASRGFMGKTWDGGDIAQRPETWRAVYDCLKPGAHLVAFAHVRTYHRMACAIEDAGFEIRDQLAWTYGAGMPKSHDVSKAFDKRAGAKRKVVSRGAAVKRMIPGADQAKSGWVKDNGREFVPEVTLAATTEAQQWSGWGTALKPAWEPICLARKPLDGTVADNVQAHGTGALNIDGCRIEGAMDGVWGSSNQACQDGRTFNASPTGEEYRSAPHQAGRWPANIIHDGSDEVLAAFPDSNGQQGAVTGNEPSSPFANVYGDMPNRAGEAIPRGDSGSAARFFYSAKAGPLDRLGSAHATVKPVDLMRWLCRLVTPPGGHVLDPFAGSGTTGIACMAEGFDCTLIELEADHHADIARKLAVLRGEGRMKFVEHDRRRDERAAEQDFGPLFSGDAA